VKRKVKGILPLSSEKSQFNMSLRNPKQRGTSSTLGKICQNMKSFEACEEELPTAMAVPPAHKIYSPGIPCLL
jgi:hypothetical protein